MTTPLILENKGVRAVFNSNTGVLEELSFKTTGWPIQRRASLGLSFRMLVPEAHTHEPAAGPDGAGAGTCTGRRNNRVLGERQRLTRFERSADGSRLTLVWDKPSGSISGPLDLTFTGTVELTPQGLRFGGLVENRTNRVVETVSWPCLGDLSSPAAEPLYRYKWGYTGLDRQGLCPQFDGDRGYFGTDYPILSGQWPYSLFMLVGNDRQGCYLGCHDISQKEWVSPAFVLKPGLREQTTSAQSGTVPPTDTISGKPVHIEMEQVHFSYAEPGTTWSLSPVALFPYAGGWQAGLDHYKQWKTTWFKPAPVPGWARDVHAWLQLQMNSPEDELRFPFTRLPEYAAECARHGIRAIQLVGWNHGGQDHGNPSHDPDPRLGTWEELKAAIAACDKLGVKIILFTKFIWGDRSTAWYRNTLHKLAMTDPYGDPYYHQGYQYQTWSQLFDLSTYRFSPMCMLSEAWRAICRQEFQKTLDLGAHGMLFDECVHHGPAWYCFNPNHGHRVPDFGFRGDSLIEEEWMAMTRKQSPDYLFAGETVYDLQYRHYAVSYGRFCGWQAQALRYINPMAGMMMAVTGFDDRLNLNRCLLHRYIISYEPYNFKGRPEDFPLTLEYGKRVDALRARYRAWLWEGEYRDAQGARVTVDGRPVDPLHFSVFVDGRTGKRAVVLINPHDTDTLSAQIAFDGGACGPLSWVTPEMPDLHPCDSHVTVAARGAVVVLEG